MTGLCAPSVNEEKKLPDIMHLIEQMEPEAQKFALKEIELFIDKLFNYINKEMKNEERVREDGEGS